MKHIIIPGLIAIAATAMAIGSRPAAAPIAALSSPKGDTIVTKRYLPGEIRDTAGYAAWKKAQEQLKLSNMFKIGLLTRSYGDSIVLRWMAPDYVGWRYLNGVGVTILRRAHDEQTVDTLVVALKPTPLEEALRIYPESDSLALMGIGLVYNKKQVDDIGQKGPTGEAGGLFGMHEDQQMQFGMAGMVAEWRADVANHMALRFVDRNVKKGKMYRYVVMPATADTTGRVSLVPARVDVENSPYKPETFDVTLEDSVTAPTTVMLAWPMTNYSSFEIERRQVSGDGGETSWQRVNQHPFVVMSTSDDMRACLYMDATPEIGTYEYRVMAHDPFGDLTEPCATHTVVVPDLVAPSPAIVTGIYLDRKGDRLSTPEIYADIHWEKQTIEPDLVGFMPFYRHWRITKGEWWQLSKTMVPPTDTTCVVDVSSLSTGEICIGTYDKAGNVSYGFQQLIRIDDVYPPHTPTGLRAETEAVVGTITLHWNRVPDIDLQYYEVSFANDPTHNFMVRKGGQVTDTCFVDTVMMEANQKYIYYKVRAVDENGNESQPSEMLEVIRPSNIPPIPAHIDSTHVDENGVFMRWICSNEKQVARHHVLRRLENESEWTLIRVCDADSVKAAGDRIDLLDVPEPNSQKEWVYAVESFNYSNVSSDLSLQYHALYRGIQYFDCQLSLQGSYDNKATHIAWEMGKEPPYKGDDWYFCIYRQGSNDEEPQFYLSAEQNERDHTDYLLQPGETAKYYIYVTYPDGRQSKPSNTVTITAAVER